MPHNKVLNAAVVFASGTLLLLGGCKQPVPQKVETAPAVSVEDLLASPQSHAHSVVQASGCFVLGLESVTLRSSRAGEPGEAIWIEDVRTVRESTCRMSYRKDSNGPQLRESYSLTTKGAMQWHGKSSGPRRSRLRQC